MKNLISIIRKTTENASDLPFSVYTSVKEQYLLNVPIVKPLLIAVLDGNKELVSNENLSDNLIDCNAGQFVFLSDSPTTNMRNIPKENEYFALLIEFEYQDFEGLPLSPYKINQYCLGDINETLETCLLQFVEWSALAPKSLWPLRRKEIIQLMYHMGYSELLSMVTHHKVVHKVHSIISEQPSIDLSNDNICALLAMSESTLRRKLKHEGSSIQDIKDQVKMGLGLHLLQTTESSISYIAQQCGYQSQSRFTERFKVRFGLTPSELRKTKMTD